MAQATTTTLGEIILAGDLANTDANNPTLRPSGVTPGTYSPPMQIHVDSKGRITWCGMPDYELEIAPYMPSASTTTEGLCRIGRRINVSSGTISVPTASTSEFGVVSIGSGLQINGSGQVEPIISDASETVKGLVQVEPGLGLLVNAGVLSRDGWQDATTSTKGMVQVSDGFSVASGVLSADAATTSTLGLVMPGTGITGELHWDSGTSKINVHAAHPSLYGLIFGYTGSYLNIDVNGELTCDLSTYPIASAGTLGFIKIGSNLTMDVDTLYLGIFATTSAKGLVQIGTNIDVSAGVISIKTGSGSDKGILQVGSNINVASGVISVATGTTGVKGILQVGTNIDVASGVISVADATTTNKGVVQIANIGQFGISSGVWSCVLNNPTSSVKGGVIVGTGFNISAGELSYSKPNTTTSTKGVVQIGTNIDVASGVISIPDATTSVKGIFSLYTGGTPATTILTTNTAPGYQEYVGLRFGRADDALLNYGCIKSADANNISIVNGDINVGSNIPQKDTVNAFIGAQVVTISNETYAASLTPNFSNSNSFETTLTGNITINNPTNVEPGGKYSIVLRQDGTGGRTLTLDSNFKTNETITLSTAANAIDVLNIIAKSTTELFVIFNKGYV